MKKILYLIVMFIITVAAAVAGDVQMPPDSKPDEQLTRDEATLRIQNYQSKVNELNQRLNSLKDGNVELKKQIEESIAALKNCNDEYYSLIKATKEDVERFAQQLGVLEGKVRQMKNLSNDELADKRADVEALENELNQMRRNRIAVLPDFYQRIIDDARDIRSLYREHSRLKTYTVGTWAENKDCLWNIAGKIEILGDPFLWPKIWQANTNIIRNPDIIRPGQELLLPVKGPKTPEETKAERRYWRNKKAAQAAAEVTPTAGNPQLKQAPVTPEAKDKKAAEAQPKKGN